MSKQEGNNTKDEKCDSRMFRGGEPAKEHQDVGTIHDKRSTAKDCKMPGNRTQQEERYELTGASKANMDIEVLLAEQMKQERKCIVKAKESKRA